MGHCTHQRLLSCNQRGKPSASHSCKDRVCCLSWHTRPTPRWRRPLGCGAAARRNLVQEARACRRLLATCSAAQQAKPLSSAAPVGSTESLRRSMFTYVTPGSEATTLKQQFPPCFLTSDSCVLKKQSSARLYSCMMLAKKSLGSAPSQEEEA